MPASSHSILVVDDDSEIRQMLATLLKLEGHSVLTATNGKEALTLARGHYLTLIILDLMMPIMSGEAFRTAQLADVIIKDIPVLILTARHDGPEVARRMQAAGCLPKPVDFDALGAFIRTESRRR
jgi:DNA-binding response OmpR family regulator